MERVTYGIYGLLEPDGFAASLAFISSEHPATVAVFNAASEGFRGEASEHDGVDGTYAGTGKHGHGQLGDHGHVQSHNIACSHGHGEQNEGRAEERNMLHLACVRIMLKLKLVSVKYDVIHFSVMMCPWLPFCTPIDFMTLAILDTWMASSP